jgi:hypothetical protein
MAVGVLSPVIFLLTENVSLRMDFADQWTLLMLVLAIIQIVLLVVLKQVRKPRKSNDGAAA